MLHSPSLVGPDFPDILLYIQLTDHFSENPKFMLQQRITSIKFPLLIRCSFIHSPIVYFYEFPGLSEVVGAFGLERLNKLMPDIIQTAERTDIPPHIRDGYIMMYIYLPGVFGDDFIPYVGPIIPSILKVSVSCCQYFHMDGQQVFILLAYIICVPARKDSESTKVPSYIV